jgi:hypothetical protein
VPSSFRWRDPKAGEAGLGSDVDEAADVAGDAERAGQTLLTVTDDEGLSLREAVDWLGQRRRRARANPATSLRLDGGHHGG